MIRISSPTATAGCCSGPTAPACRPTPGRSSPARGPLKSSAEINGHARTVLRFDGEALLAFPRRVPVDRQPVRRLPAVGHGQPGPAPARLGRFRRRQARARPACSNPAAACTRSSATTASRATWSIRTRPRVSSSSASPGAREARRCIATERRPVRRKGVDALSSDPAVAALRLGGPGSGGSPRFQGELAEIRVYDRQLDEAERRLVEAELRASWLDPAASEDAADRPARPSCTRNCSRPEARSGSPPTSARQCSRPKSDPGWTSLSRELDVLKKKKPRDIPQAVVVQDGGPKGTRHEGFKDAQVFLRGNSKRLGKTVPRGVPHVLRRRARPPGADHRGKRPARAGRMARASRQPADGARHGQPDLAAPLRRGTGSHAQRLRRARRAADQPRSARLAGRAVRRVGLVGQGDAPADHAVVGLPAEQPRRGRRARQGPGQSSLRPNEPPATRCRSDSRQPAGRGRTPRRRRWADRHSRSWPSRDGRCIFSPFAPAPARPTSAASSTGPIPARSSAAAASRSWPRRPSFS